jgi:glycine cleavage system H protein
MEFPADLKYTDNDEWLRVEGEVGTTGITDYAQDQLSDVVYVEVTAAVGEELAKGEVYGLVESVKAAADVYLPVSGVITEINEALADTPELVNTDPYGEAWMVKFEIKDPAELDELLEIDTYQQSVEERSS